MESRNQRDRRGVRTGPAGQDVTDVLRWGMSREEVRLLYTGALRDPLPDEIGQAVIAGAQVAGCAVDARLFFDGSGLERVTADARGNEIERCEDWEHRLRARYGTPALERKDPNDVLVTWKLPQTEIEAMRVVERAPGLRRQALLFSWVRRTPGGGAPSENASAP